MKYDLDWVISKYDAGEALKCLFFWGHTPKGSKAGKFMFSQWFPSPFTIDGIVYKTAEHWMMARKALLFDAPALVTQIVNTEKPGEAKDLGRRIEKFNEAAWNEVKYEIVLEGTLHKFRQNEGLKKFLMETGNRVLVEASPTDAIWGIGLAEDAMQIENPHRWKGQNLLGFALMEARDILRQQD